jgi:hypothetical protein
MTLFYAMGSGWGHLYRTKMIASMFGKQDLQVLTTNPIAYQLIHKNQVVLISPDEMNSSHCRDTLKNHLSDPTIKEVFIDTFPLGIMGELDEPLLSGKKINYVARRMKWEAYLNSIEPNNFTQKIDTTYVLEPLEDRHQHFINTNSEKIEALKIEYPKPDYSRVQIANNKNNDSIWLIVHSENKEEVESIYQYARDCAALENVVPYFIIISDQAIDLNTQGECISNATAADWFPFADRIFTAGGFNTLYQMELYLHKHTGIPLPRKFDDQNWRINYILKKKENNQSFISQPF